MAGDNAKLKIGDLVRETGLSERMLRHYEALGILNPRKSAGGTRLYSSADVEVARLIGHFRELDFSLEALADLASERARHDTGDASSRSVAEMLEGLAADLAHRAEKALALHRVVLEARKAVAGCRGCQNRPAPSSCPDCPMNAETDRNPLAAMVWFEDQK